jgi:O-antigen ligase
MSFITEHGPLLTGILLLPVLLVVAAVFAWSRRRFEIMAGLVFASPWVHWLFATNEDILSSFEAIEETVATGPGTYIRLGIIGLAGVAGLLHFLASRDEDYPPVPRQFSLLGAFFVLALVSTTYSIAPQFTFVRSVESLAFLGFLLGLYVALREQEVLDRVLTVASSLMGAGLVVNVLALVLLPGLVWWSEAPKRFQGLTGHPNEMGALCMIAFPLLLWRYCRSKHVGKGVCVILMGLATAMLLLSGSRASLLCALVAVLLWFLVLGKRMIFIATTSTMAVVVLLLLSSPLLPSLQREQASAKGITDLTGREQFWENGIHVVKQRPLLGYGYEVSGEVWTDPRFATSEMEDAWGSARSSLHNGYLSIVIGLGLIAGLVLWPIILLAPLPNLLRLPPSDYKAVALLLVGMCLAANFVETSITSSRSFTSVTFWIFWVMASALPVTLSASDESAVPEAARPVRLQPGLSGDGVRP